VAADQYDAEDTVVIPANVSAQKEEDSAEEKSGAPEKVGA